MSSITIIGSGNMARGIGTRAAAAGYGIQVLDRDPSNAAALAGDLSSATSGALGEAPAGDIVVLALPYGAVAEVVRQYGAALDGKVLVDITNPVDFQTFAGLVTPPDSSAAQEIAKLVPGAKVVKAFNTTFASTLVRPPRPRSPRSSRRQASAPSTSARSPRPIGSRASASSTSGCRSARAGAGTPPSR